MSQGTHTAIKCFDENRNLFGNPQREPEKFNLYNGLAGLAESLSQLEMQVATLTQEIASLRAQLQR
jgi:uncharacterized small protein (DUF1192 family)